MTANGIAQRRPSQSTELTGTIVMPTGFNAIKASLMCWIPKGMPTMLTKQARAELRWPIANHQPATRNQSTLPISPSGPVPRSPRPLNSSRFTASCPNGQSENLPITKQERAQGSPMIVIAHSHVTPEEVGSEWGPGGEELRPGDDGFLQAMCARIGATYSDETRTEEPSESAPSTDGTQRDQDPSSSA